MFVTRLPTGAVKPSRGVKPFAQAGALGCTAAVMRGGCSGTAVDVLLLGGAEWQTQRLGGERLEGRMEETMGETKCAAGRPQGGWVGTRRAQDPARPRAALVGVHGVWWYTPLEARLPGV